MKQDIFKKPKHMTSIGGQALIEGLMMIGPKNAAIAIRKPDGEIVVEKRPVPKKGRVSKLPIIRGFVGIFKQMVLGIKALMYSAEFVDLEDDKDKEPSKVDKFLDRILGDKLQDVLIYISVIFSIIFSVFLFMVLPNLVASILPVDKSTGVGTLIYNVVEGVVRVGIFIGYLALTSLMKDIRRVWQYHGAEHKTIHCYENEEELTVENVKKYSTRHPRCGTSFLFTIMVVSILVFSLVGQHGLWINILLRVVLIPLVAGISYEIIKISGRSQSKIARIINAPGLMFQAFTTREPDDSQIEVAIEAMKNVMVENREEDRW
ncbi:MAG TPA: DUF1385 domain-containing protein [Hungateiclostridium thermocellum]|jgi:uncharacterized protein YqhQ|uniref:DUF1385 domain-containing protein n=2 Tax=Acetivibrio thermocellus TaxID=1515 RepID=A3DI50_ACET2|nr:DUF1385 domain-containing protein [Acetivibrio thermocellus]CDG36950.1 hypothetical protein CTHBC1_2356 [Acetivibrio thermocellus BC1]ABN53629.1 protein of unknown function DUF1385 [Acetivibrio thermocellus ATCC 27405]ADU73157.1 protein of unknown function DUF1385 [Acetivibrio thermocellus DSM 1313]ALX07070.1 protein of unknown function DUF1385 [Acetivibrio thermocellus AD2]ANV74806.1 protein of unknown function DUF1385 [Acetivibrio thermocellus DSM 2360]